MRLSKNHAAASDDRAAGELEGGKARLEYNSPPLEKPCFTRLFENSILCTAKMLGGEAQSKNPTRDFFDKLGYVL